MFTGAFPVMVLVGTEIFTGNWRPSKSTDGLGGVFLKFFYLYNQNLISNRVLQLCVPASVLQTNDRILRKLVKECFTIGHEHNFLIFFSYNEESTLR
jgi:hypothetical protein